MNDFLKAIGLVPGRSVIVSSFLPAALFLVLLAFLLTPLWPPFLTPLISHWFPSLAAIAVLWLLVSAFIGYALFSLNDVVYRLFEGYYLAPEFRRAYHRRRRVELYARVALLIREKERLERSKEPDAVRLDQVRAKLAALQSQFSTVYPPLEQVVMATSFGNVLKAYEAYSGDRYGINAVLSWPLLLHVIPDSYYQTIEERNNFVTFALNSSLLLFVLAIVSFLAAGYDSYSKPEWLSVHISAGIFALVFGYSFYKGSGEIALGQGNLVRSCYDLFRFDLLKQLHLSLPLDIEQERRLWNKLEDFWLAGPTMKSTALRKPWFVYQHPDPLKKTSNVMPSVPQENPEQYPGSEPKP